MNITVNGEVRTVNDGISIAALVAGITGEPDAKGIAVAVDRCVVPRSEWGTTWAAPGAVLEIVTAAPGG